MSENTATETAYVQELLNEKPRPPLFGKSAAKGKRAFVLGFLFSPTRDGLVLIEKPHGGPAGDAPHWNGVGGKIKDGEEARDAMVREFEEETSVRTAPGDWNYFAFIESTDWTVACYTMVSLHAREARTNEHEAVELHLVDDVLRGLVPVPANLRWLIPMALDALTSKRGLAAVVRC